MCKFAGLGFFTLCFIFAGTVAFVNSQPSSALTYEGGASVGFDVKDTINISLTGSLVIPDLMTGTSDDSNAMSVQVSMNTGYGYSLSAQMKTASADLTASGATTKFTGLASDASVSSLSADTWGYKTSTNSGSTWSNYSGLPISTGSTKTLVDKDSKPSGGTETTQIKVGAYASSAMEASTYTNTIVFTAIAKDPPAKYMQDIDSWRDTELARVNDTIQAVDQRDNKLYWVTKLADGNIWMTQNLDLDLNATTLPLTSATSDVSANWNPGSTYYTKTATSSSSTKTDMYSWDLGDYVYDGTTNSYCGTSATSYADCTDYGFSLATSLAADSTQRHYHVGNNYQWNAATAGTGGTITSGQATDSICPKGWRLPTSKTGGEFQVLSNTYGVTSGTSTTGTVQTLINSPLYFVRGGNVYSGTLRDAGNVGYYWSSTPSSGSSYAYSLYFGDNSDVVPFDDYGRYYGFSVRCVARAPQKTATISVNNASYGSVSPSTVTTDQGSAISTSSNTITIGSTTVTATANSGYAFDSWTNNCGSTLSDNCTVIANFQEQTTPTTMQGMTSAYCASMATGATLTLTDTRNNKSYNIAKLADGHCWMKENLSLGSSSTITLTPSDSDVTSNFTLPASSTWDDSSENKTTPRLYLDSNNSGTSRDEVFYNWVSATANSGNSLTTQGDVAPSSICPKGWRLPTTNDTNPTNYEFYQLFSPYITTGTWNSSGYWSDVTVSNYTNPPLSLSFAGVFDTSIQTVYDLGYGGYWWSSVASGSNSAFNAYADSYGIVNLVAYNRRYGGLSVRCVAQ